MSATWLSLASAIIAALAASAAWGNVIWTNRRADARELSKWQREQVMTTVAHLLSESAEIVRFLTENDDWNEDSLPAKSDEGIRSVKRMRPFANNLRVFASAIDTQVSDLLDALEKAVDEAIDKRGSELTGNMTAEDRREAAEWHREAFAAVRQSENALVDGTREVLGLKPTPVK